MNTNTHSLYAVRVCVYEFAQMANDQFDGNHSDDEIQLVRGETKAALQKTREKDVLSV